jgi:molecular chaperone GrpE
MSDEDRPDDARPRIRITDRRRFVDGPEGGVAPADEAGTIPPRGGDVGGVGASGADPRSDADAEAADVATDLEAARAEASQYLDHLKRLQAEFDNYRKRVLKEQTTAIDMAAEPVVRRLLEVLDEFELALMAATEKPDFDRFLHGVELVYAKLLDSLRAEGLERIEADGKPFNPERHEALMQTGDGDGDPMVADVLRPGYTLRGRVIRPAGVRVERR